MKTFLLVFDDGSKAHLDLRAFVDQLDDDAQMYTLDGHVCFIKSALGVEALSDRFMEVCGSSLFFVTEINEDVYSGRMVGRFWDFLNDKKSIASAA